MLIQILKKFAIVSIFLASLTLMTNAQTPEELAAIWENSHITNKFPSNVRHKDLVVYIEKLKALGVDVQQVGESLNRQSIYQAEWGKGKTRVFMWSQMHGDEPTATSAVIDMLAFLQQNRTKLSWVQKLYDSVTLRIVPMLNPDGADLYQRRNLQGIDINRDARNLRTPEANLLMKLRNEFMPEIGFNLHNQQELTAAGNAKNQASISILAVKANPETPVSEAQLRNERICSLMVKALEKFIPGNVGRYDDTYTESAFGDTFSDLGTPVILVETGGLHEKDENYLVKMNFVILLTALESVANCTQQNADPSIYKTLPENTGGKLYNYIFRNASVISYGAPKQEIEDDVNDDYIDEPAKPTETESKDLKITVEDIGVNRERRREEITLPPTFVRRVGNLSGARGLTEFDASGYYVISSDGPVRAGSRGGLLFYKKSRKLDWNVENTVQKNTADAIFARGRWLTGGELFKKK
ncbi:MAG: M14 family zinc carboxypeptidase [Pyrinomonadaceae bacterium]